MHVLVGACVAMGPASRGKSEANVDDIVKQARLGVVRRMVLLVIRAALHLRAVH